jgi:hypothetical protein
MSDLRQSLKDVGWRQGVILKPGPFPQKEAFGFLVLNQTCDCINPSFEKEPHLELLPLENWVGGSPVAGAKTARIPVRSIFR